MCSERMSTLSGFYSVSLYLEYGKVGEGMNPIGNGTPSLVRPGTADLTAQPKFQVG
jgi:hypothetical protein